MESFGRRKRPRAPSVPALDGDHSGSRSASKRPMVQVSRRHIVEVDECNGDTTTVAHLENVPDKATTTNVVIQRRHSRRDASGAPHRIDHSMAAVISSGSGPSADDAHLGLWESLLRQRLCAC